MGSFDCSLDRLTPAGVRESYRDMDGDRSREGGMKMASANNVVVATRTFGRRMERLNSHEAVASFNLCR
jgi:hypothetical protein